MKRESVRLEPDIQGLLKHRAEERNMTLSEYMRQLLMLGLEKERELATKSYSYSKLEKILLKNSIENTMLLNVIVGEKNPKIVKEIKEKSNILFKELTA